MYMSDIIYLAFLLILVFVIIYKGFKSRADIEVNTIYRNTNTTPTNNNRRRRSPRAPDRQGNIFTIADNTSANNGAHRCNDFFYVESSANDAARIRAQLEKDDKDLPTYEEVMGLSAEANRNLSTLPPTPGGASIIAASNASVATTDTMLVVPPYSEIDTHTITNAPATPATRSTTVNTAANVAAATPLTSAAQNSGTVVPPAPSTSRAAASSSSVTLTIPAVASHTSV